MLNKLLTYTCSHFIIYYLQLFIIDSEKTGGETNAGDIPTPKKKRKAGAAVCQFSFDEQWSKKWPFIVKTKSSNEFR